MGITKPVIFFASSGSSVYFRKQMSFVLLYPSLSILLFFISVSFLCFPLSVSLYPSLSLSYTYIHLAKHLNSREEIFLFQQMSCDPV